MIRLHLICEGSTEEVFANNVLWDHFQRLGIELRAGKIGKPGRKGGNVTFDRVCSEVTRRLKSDRQAHCTTLFDFYGLPQNFPGRVEASSKSSIALKFESVTQALVERLTMELGEDPMRRFVPYIQMHEFEGLLFSDPERSADAIGQAAIAARLRAIRDQFETPEHINDSPQTAPSKRILALYDAFDKPRHGAIAAKRIGLAGICSQCPLFDAWIRRLESLAPSRLTPDHDDTQGLPCN